MIIPSEFRILDAEPKVYTIDQRTSTTTVPVAYALFTEGGHYDEENDEYEEGTYVVHMDHHNIAHVIMCKDFFVAQGVLKEYMEATQNTAYISGCPLESVNDGHRVRYYESASVIVDMTVVDYLVRIKK
jgi:hypothetical protein